MGWRPQWSDDFNRADGTLDTDTYPKIWDTDSGYPIIENNAVLMTPNDDAGDAPKSTGCYYNTMHAYHNLRFGIQIKFGSSASIGSALMLLRYDPETGSNYSLAISVSDSADNVHPDDDETVLTDDKLSIFKTERDGTVTLLGSTTFAAKAYTTNYVVFEAMGDKLKVYIGPGFESLVFTPADVEVADKFGIRLASGDDNYYFSITADAATVKSVVEELKTGADARKAGENAPWDIVTASEDDETLTLTSDDSDVGISAIAYTTDGGGTDDQTLTLVPGAPVITGEPLLEVTDSSWRDNGWAAGTFAFGAVFVGAEQNSGGNYSFVEFDNARGLRYGGGGGMIRDVPQVCYDEPRNLLRFSMPTDGGQDADQVYVYHLDTGEWTIEDTNTSCMGTILDDRGQKIAVYGKQASGYFLYKIDETATREGSAITSTWTSNWIELTPDPYGRVSVEKLQTFLALAEGNECEVSVEVADDPDDPTTITQYTYTAGYDSNIPNTIGLGGRFVRVSIANSQSAGAIDLRRILMELLA